jgi:hypothetical protein
MVIGAQEPIELDAEVRHGEVISQNVKGCGISGGAAA